MRLSATLLAAVVATPAVAQPPTYSRWTGSTASAQPQGFGQGNPITLTWGFMAPGTPLAGSANNLPARLDAIYGAGSQATVWQPLFASVFDRWSSVSGLSFRYEPNDDGVQAGSGGASGQSGVRADIRIGGVAIDGNSNVLARNFFPNNGDMTFDTSDNFFENTANNSIRLRNVTSHELGHGIGMPHVDSTGVRFLMNPTYNGSFDGPQFHDILAAQHMYGDALEKANAGLGNDTAARATPLGTVTPAAGVTVGASARTLAVAPTANDFVSIDSQTDTDFYRLTVTDDGPVTAVLRPLGFTYNVTSQGAGGNVPFNTTQRSNLALAVFAADGTTLIDSASAAGLGGDEAVTFDAAAGEYVLRVTGANNPDAIALDTQFYELGVSFVPIPEPAAVLAVAVVALSGWTVRRQWVTLPG